jgi:hypothetical protein
MTRKKPLCIFHAKCDDGFGAALAVYKAFAREVDLWEGVHGQPPPAAHALDGRDVVLVDFSYKRPWLEKLMENCASLLVLDHHKTAQEDLAFLEPAKPTWNEHLAWVDGNQSPVERKCPGAALFDMTRSGAMIAWQYFHRQDPPLFYQYLQDRDLWTKKLEGGDAFSIALRSYPQDLATWGRLMYNAMDLVHEGEPILRYYRQRIDELKATAVLNRIAGYTVPTVNAPYFAASEVAGELCTKDVAFAACYFYNGHGWQFSLRSRADFDVSVIAKTFGGGGHAQAAGFTAQTLPWEKV